MLEELEKKSKLKITAEEKLVEGCLHATKAPDC